MAIRGRPMVGTQTGGNSVQEKWTKSSTFGALSTFIKAKLFLSVYIDNIRIVGRREWKLSAGVVKAAKED